MSQPEPPPPAIAAISPLHEVLIQDVAASVPAEWRSRVNAAATITELNDWLAAAAMFRWVASEPLPRHVLVDTIGNNPRNAALALASAVAARMQPPSPDVAWRVADRLGALLQIALVLSCLAVRAVLIGWLSQPPNAFAVSTLEFWLTGIVDLPLLTTSAAARIPLLAAWLCASLWHAFELAFAPRLFERGRQWPARLRRLPPPRSWRVDTFDVIWRVHVCALLAAMAYRVAGVIHAW